MGGLLGEREALEATLMRTHIDTVQANAADALQAASQLRGRMRTNQAEMAVVLLVLQQEVQQQGADAREGRMQRSFQAGCYRPLPATCYRPLPAPRTRALTLARTPRLPGRGARGQGGQRAGLARGAAAHPARQAFGKFLVAKPKRGGASAPSAQPARVM